MMHNPFKAWGSLTHEMRTGFTRANNLALVWQAVAFHPPSQPNDTSKSDETISLDLTRPSMRCLYVELQNGFGHRIHS